MPFLSLNYFVTDYLKNKRYSIGALSNASGALADEDGIYPVGGLAHTHFQQRVINVSNAPPVSLTQVFH